MSSPINNNSNPYTLEEFHTDAGQLGRINLGGNIVRAWDSGDRVVYTAISTWERFFDILSSFFYRGRHHLESKSTARAQLQDKFVRKYLATAELLRKELDNSVLTVGKEPPNPNYIFKSQSKEAMEHVRRLAAYAAIKEHYRTVHTIQKEYNKIMSGLNNTDRIRIESVERQLQEAEIMHQSMLREAQNLL